MEAKKYIISLNLMPAHDQPKPKLPRNISREERHSIMREWLNSSIQEPYLEALAELNSMGISCDTLPKPSLFVITMLTPEQVEAIQKHPVFHCTPDKAISLP
jgi:hypothetical protein